MLVKLTEFGKKLPKAQQEQALALADVAKRLEKARDELYPGVHPRQWTEEMRDEIWTRAEEEWADEQRRTVGG